MRRCAEGSVDWAALYYCHASPAGHVWAVGLVCVGFAVLVLLFRVMSTAADDFFSCVLTQLSQDMGLPPRLGGGVQC